MKVKNGGRINNMNLKLEDFKQWLLTKKRNEVVGKTFNCHYCPIANYVKESSKEEIVVVGDKKLYLKSGTFNHPEWTKNFINSIDRNQRNITTEEALFKLSKVEHSLR